MSTAMTQSVDAIARSLSADVNQLDIISQNVANMRTPGYRAERSFSALAGVRLDLSDAALENTGRQEDLALRGQGFFAVDVNGQVLLERNGAFHVDSQHRLVDATGHAVQGEDGVIDIEGQTLKVGSDGVVSVDGKAVDRLHIVAVTDPALVKEAGSGLYSYAGTEGEWIGSVRQGALEEANVDASGEMVRLIEVTRHAQAVQHAIQAYDEALQSGINHLGENT
jgi:flagellar basal body rod protein FlgG